MKDGWIKLYRSSFENRLYFDEPFTRFQAWIDLLLLANHKDGSFFKRGNIVKVPRGTVARSMKELADRWQWSEAKVSRFIQFLESEYIRQVKAQKSNVTTLITILNYDRYQTNEGAEFGANVSTDDAQTTTYKNVKNNKENNTLPNFEFHNIQNSGLVRRGLTPPPSTPADVVLPDKKFKPSDFSGLTEDQVKKVITGVKIVKSKEISEEDVRQLWDLFLTTELCKKTYAGKDAVFSHFFNYMKRQPFSKNIKSAKKAESNLRPFRGEIRGLKFSEDFTLCEMEDGSIVKLTANQKDLAENKLLSPQNVKK
jgi:hypothetical protein